MALAYPPGYLDRVAWADEKCAAIETPWFDLSILPVSWDDATRQGHLLQAIRYYGEDSDNAWDNGADDEANDYFSNIGFLIFLCFIMVGVSMICCGFPLWIARCCAHRCCRHSAKPYTINARRRAVGCCTLAGILTFVFFVIGTLAGAASTPGIQETMCGYDTLLRNSTSFVYNVDTYITNLRDLVARAQVENNYIISNLTCVQATFTEPGAVASACAAMTAAQAAANSVDSRVQTATGSSASALSAAFAASLTEIGNTRTLLCTTLAGTAPAVANALVAVNDLTTPLQIASELSEIIDSVHRLERDQRDSHHDFLNTMRDTWDALDGGANFAAGVLFVPHIIFIVLGIAGGLCMTRRPKGRPCTTNSCGVQSSGCGWVFYTALAPYLFLIAAIFMCLAVFMSDAGYLALEIPRDPHTQLGSTVCNRWTDSFGDGDSISYCTVIQGCFADSPVSMWTTIGPSLSFNMSDTAAAIRTAIDATDFAAGAPFNFTQLQQAAVDAQSIVASVGGLSAATFGISSGHAQYEPINTDLAALSANLTTANSVILASSDYRCADSAQTQTSVLLGLADDVLVLTDDSALDALFQCGFYRTAVDGVIVPSFRGPVRDASGAVAISLLLAGIFALLLVWSVIALQIEYGDVGIEPGCCSICRCLCCYRPGRNATAGRLVSPNQAKADGGCAGGVPIAQAQQCPQTSCATEIPGAYATEVTVEPTTQSV